MREDIAKLDQYIEQMDFLYQHKIGDVYSLQSKKESLQSELKHQIVERRKLYTIKERAERNNDAPLILQTKAAINVASGKIKKLRKEISLCEAVTASSDRVEKALEDLNKKPELDSHKIKDDPKKNKVRNKQDMTL